MTDLGLDLGFAGVEVVTGGGGPGPVVLIPIVKEQLDENKDWQNIVSK